MPENEQAMSASTTRMNEMDFWEKMARLSSILKSITPRA
jgi:hypothetical protein